MAKKAKKKTKKSEEISNKKLLVVIAIILLLSLVGFTLAYFVGQIGSGATANINVTTATVDTLTFSTGADVSIGPVTQQNFAEGQPNQSGSTTASAQLRANSTTNSATETYNLYVNITNNTFHKTSNNAELILTITDPTNTAVTSLSGLTYTTVKGVSGFDVTEKTGLIQIASDYTITVPNASNNPKTDTWNITLTFVNLDSDQTDNAGASFQAQAIIQKDAYAEQASYWIDFSGQGYTTGSQPATTYPTLAQLRSNYTQFESSLVFVKSTKDGSNYYVLSDNEDVTNNNLYDIAENTNFLSCEYIEDTTKNDGSGTFNCTILNGNTYSFYGDASSLTIEDDFANFEKQVKDALVTAGYLRETPKYRHQACLYYNNHEFCLGSNYWDTDGTTTKTKLKTAMEAALGTTADRCESGSSYADCYFDSSYCSVISSNYVSCYDNYGNSCRINNDGSASCGIRSV